MLRPPLFAGVFLVHVYVAVPDWNQGLSDSWPQREVQPGSADSDSCDRHRMRGICRVGPSVRQAWRAVRTVSAFLSDPIPWLCWGRSEPTSRRRVLVVALNDVHPLRSADEFDDFLFAHVETLGAELLVSVRAQR